MTGKRKNPSEYIREGFREARDVDENRREKLRGYTAIPDTEGPPRYTYKMRQAKLYKKVGWLDFNVITAPAIVNARYIESAIPHYEAIAVLVRNKKFAEWIRERSRSLKEKLQQIEEEKARRKERVSQAK